VVYREREIVVSGERRARRPGAGAGFLCLERPHGRFERTIPFDVAVDVAQAQASLKDGILTITLPRLKERRGRETVIPIEWEQEE
jgi:HSP20 family protein